MAPTVVGEHELALHATRVRRRGQGVQQEHHVDVGGERVRLGARAFERRSTHERTASREDEVDPLTVGGRDDPIAHRDVGADVAQPQLRAVRSEQQRAPAAIEP